MKKIYILLLLSINFQLFAQEPTIGLKHYDSSTYDGLTLFTPERSGNVYLMNNCGQVVNSWNTGLNTLISYITESGDLLVAGGGEVEIRDWDNNLLWHYDFRANGYRLHHDIEPLPNGNFLIITNDIRNQATAIQAGRNPALIDTNVKLDSILEIEPTGTNSFNIVWQWNIFDHLVQDFDSSKDNFGVVADSPHLIDFNYQTSDLQDWTHVNSVDYNSTLDQIVISARSMSEIYIIDHSTTTAEAAGHTEGNSGKGGDILWRWGNPVVYQQGAVSDQKLFEQHDPTWISNPNPNEGMLTIFSNNSGSDYSSVLVVNPNTNSLGNYTFSNGNLFAPDNEVWSWNGQVQGENVFSNKKGGFSALPNGNYLISETVNGRIIEIDNLGNTVWVYRIPEDVNGIINQYSSNYGSVFKCYKYPTDYIGFNSQDLTPQGIIENENILSDDCVSALSIENSTTSKIKIYPNPTNSIINFKTSTSNSLDVSIYNSQGIKVFSKNEVFERLVLPSTIESGIYFVKVTNVDNKNTKTIKLIIN